jgi:hypothetical protein
MNYFPVQKEWKVRARSGPSPSPAQKRGPLLPMGRAWAGFLRPKKTRPFFSPARHLLRCTARACLLPRPGGLCTAHPMWRHLSTRPAPISHLPLSTAVDDLSAALRRPT